MLKGLANACVVLVAGVCHAADFPPLRLEPSSELVSLSTTRVQCELPDGGAPVFVYDVLTADTDAECALAPLFCASPAARARVLEAVDAGTLNFPTPRSTVMTDARGVFELPASWHDTVARVECADGPLLWRAPSRPSFGLPDVLSRSTGPGEWLQRSAEVGRDEQLKWFRKLGRLLVVNPWTRRVAVLAPDEVALADRELVARAWVTTLDRVPARTKAPGDRWDVLTREDEPEWHRGYGSPPDAPSWAVDGGALLQVRVERSGLEPRRLSFSLTRTDGGDEHWETTALANGYDFALAPGDYALRVSSPGAAPVERRVALTVRGEQLVFPLEAGRGTAVRVVMSDGGVVGQALVSVDGTGSNIDFTGTDGFFGFDHELSPGQRVQAVHPRFGRSAEVRVSAPGVLTLELHPSNGLELVVQTPDGSPVFGEARVTRKGSDETFRFPFTGEVRAAGLLPGRYAFRLSTAEWAALEFELDVPPVGKPRRVVRMLTPPPALTGVLLEDGKPMAATRIGVSCLTTRVRSEVTTGADGAFVVRCGRPGEALLSVEGASLPVKLPGVGARIELSPKPEGGFTLRRASAGER